MNITQYRAELLGRRGRGDSPVPEDALLDSLVQVDSRAQQETARRRGLGAGRIQAGELAMGEKTMTTLTVTGITYLDGCMPLTGIAINSDGDEVNLIFSASGEASEHPGALAAKLASPW